MPGYRVTKPIQGERGPQGFSVKSAAIVGTDLIITLTSGTQINAGTVSGGGGGSVNIASTANETTASYDSGTNTWTIGLVNDVIVSSVKVATLKFDTTVTAPSLNAGEMSWDTDHSTVILQTNNGINFHLGTGLYQRVHNNSGVTINKGDIVYVSGSHGTDRLAVTKAQANSEATSAPTVGLACEQLLHGADGYIQVYGLLQGLDTNIYSAGQPIYLSETIAGGWRTSLPTAPDHGTFVGWIVKSAGSGAGSIFVKIHNYNELEELSDVYIPSPSDGNVLTYSTANSRWQAAAPATVITDHGALTGLGDDDHTQYHTDARGDARYSLLGHTHPLSALQQSGATLGQVPTWNGSAWVAQTPTGGGGGGSDETALVWMFGG